MLTSELLTPSVGAVRTPPLLLGPVLGRWLTQRGRAVEHAEETSSPVILGVK